MAAKLKTAVLGATGYSGLELTRILLRHPRLEKPTLLRRSADNGSAADLADVFPALSGNGGYPLHALSWSALKQQGVQLLFLATPHERIGKAVQMCLERNCELQELPLSDLQSLSPAFGEDFHQSLTLASVLAVHDVPGGTAPNRVRHAIAAARNKIESLREEVHAHA